MTCNLCLDAGACRMKVKIIADLDDEYKVKLNIETNCPNINKIKDKLTVVDPLTEISNSGFAGSSVYEWAKELPHVACPAPCAIVKAVEVAGGLGVKRDVQMNFTEE
ncbi:DUF6951 family protein [Candidatus Methanoprimaticola sp. MG2]|uniref:DUF6951 family protein n=1 Tax=Candidatus Methanoprimaticola sp. MG2 TaxID=3228838 RepID=UPI0039C722E9